MLELLRVRAFAIIDELEVHFAPGFNALTGETGAGKTILVDALHLVLGGRALSDSVRTGAEEAEVQALFRPRDPEACDARLAALGLPAAGAELVVRRTVQREGRSRAFINGALATASQLQQATRGLLDISGQHEHVGLLDAALHLDLLDAHAALGPLRGEYAAAFAALAEAERGRAQLDSDESARVEKADWLRYQLDELVKADPQPGEDEKLAQERRVLAAAEKLRAGALETEGLLSEAGVAKAARRLEEMAAIDPSLSALAQSVRGAAAEISEAARELGRYASRTGGDPRRLEDIEERLEVLRKLARKHGGSLQSALQRREQMKAELAALENHDEELARRTAEVQKLATKARALAEQLSQKRRSAAAGFSQSVVAELRALGMARSELAVRFSEASDGAPEEPALPATAAARKRGALIEGLGPRGLETAELLLSPNPGEELRPLARIASGGELSRVLLAVKRVLAESDPVDAYLFDEVDAGIGGATADAVGRALAAVARGRQVICITHLPQIAVFAGRHLTVEKEIAKGRTFSRIAVVEGDDRVRELARLLSGKPTEVALEHARELLASAREPKRARKAG
ncbi:MAG: DNA repair protein RecN [Deltaproteobacteria bacterium]|nr:MAG: DNA repair protein RecN [Deltaproteobacteria bacterium]